MAVEIKMPQLSDTMDAGKILSWNKAEGDRVERGEILAEVETDKANLEIESFHAGTLLKIMVPAQSSAKVGDVIAYVGDAGESAPGGSADGGAQPAAPAASTNGGAPSAAPAKETPAPAAQPSESKSTERIKTSPLAKKIAQQHGVDLRNIQGSGPDGRIIKKDVEGAFEQEADAPAARPAPSPASSAPPPQSDARPAPAAETSGGTSQELSKMRATIARRMQEAVREAPHFYTTIQVNMGEALKLRAILKEREEYKGISVNHLVIKAAAYALSHEPRVNCAMRDGKLYTPNAINIGIVVALEDGLLIPVVKSADTLSLRDIVFEARAAVDRARAGRPSSSDLSGGTFSISNMGMFDVKNFTAIINPGQGAILAVGAVSEEPIVQNGQIVIGSMMQATLSVDHRIIDGVMAGTFLKHLKEALEVPALLSL